MKFETFSTDQIIQIVGVAIALFASVSSIILSVISLVKSRIAAEAAARPYISMQIEAFEFTEALYYIVVKNYGNSPARIEKITYSFFEEKQPASFPLHSSLDSLEGSTLYPNQTVYYPFDKAKANLNGKDIRVTYKYAWKKSFWKKRYTEQVNLNITNSLRLPHLRVVPKRDTDSDTYDYERGILFTLQEIAERITFK